MTRPKPRFELFVNETMKGLRHFWRLIDGAGIVLAVSRAYGTRSSALRGAKRTKAMAVDAEIQT